MLSEKEKKQLVNLGHLEIHTKEAQAYIAHEKADTEAHVHKVAEDLATETTERAKQDSLLLTRINDERVHTDEVEATLSNAVAFEQARAINQEALIRQEVKTAIEKEVGDRNDAINAERKSIDEARESDFINITEQFNTTATRMQAAITTEYQTLDTRLQHEVNTRTTQVDNLQAQINAEVDNRKSADTALRRTIDDHILSFNTDTKTLNDHVANRENPHNVTLEQLGAAAEIEFVQVRNRVDNIEAVDRNQETRLQTAEAEIDNLQADVLGLEATKLNVTGNNQSLHGSLTISKDADGASGDLIVQGNLTVKGVTKTVEHETIAVKDNFLIINSDNEEVGSSLTGIAMRTGVDEKGEDTAYGIAYDTDNDSISLGQGVVHSDGEFVFKAGESKPILTRDVSTNLQDGHLLVWDASRNVAVDGGAYDLETLQKTFSTWEDNHKLAAEIHDLDNTDTTAGELGRVTKIENELKDVIHPNLDAIEENIDQVEANLATEIQTRDTADKNINEHLDAVEAQLNAHEARVDNPHDVKWTQIQNQALATSIPLMDQSTAVTGTSTFVARADHVHPTDTSRAPNTHTFSGTAGTTDYGKATTGLYGHVKFAASVSADDDNVVSAKSVKTYVDSEIQKLDVGATTLTPGQTVKSISEADGKIAVETQDIEVTQSQVSGLVTRLDNLDDYVTVDSGTALQEVVDELREDIDNNSTAIEGITTDLGETKEKVNKNTQDLAEEVTNRTSADAAVAKLAQDNLESVRSTLQANIDAIELLDSRIVLDGDLTFTKPFGKYTVPASGSYTISSTNSDGSKKTLRQLFEEAFSETSVGTITQPSYSFSAPGNQEGEIGSTYTLPSATFTVTSVGSYQYGSETGADTGITYSGTLTGTGATDVTFSALGNQQTAKITAVGTNTYIDGTTTYSFGGSYSHTAGAAPKTNLGGTDSSKAISGKTNQSLGTKTVTFTGYNKMFIGVANKSTGFTSAEIRALNKINTKAARITNREFTANAGDKTIVIAYPTSLTTSAPKLETQSLGTWNEQTLVAAGTINVTDASLNTATAKQYYIYTYTPSSGSFEADTPVRVSI